MNRKPTQRVIHEARLLVPQKRIQRGKHDGKIATERSDHVWATPGLALSHD